MNHTRCRAWLFDEELTSEQRTGLAAHLRDCEACRALATGRDRAEAVLADAGMVAPAPGFSGRWLARRRGEQARQYRRQTSLVTAALSLGAALTALALLPQAWWAVRSVDSTLADATKRAVAWILGLARAFEMSSVLAGSLLSTVPFSWWLFAMTMIAAGGGLAIWILTRLPNLAQERGVRA